MKKIDTLRKSALESCKFRGHQMKPFKHFDKITAFSVCRVCGKSVAISTNPPPNGIDIGGEAVALGCRLACL
jgi:hypothetical protein